MSEAQAQENGDATNVGLRWEILSAAQPSDALGDLESAGDYLDFMDRAGYGDVVGFNRDCSHMERQAVSGIEFIRGARGLPPSLSRHDETLQA
jgi:hypothetical protein